MILQHLFSHTFCFLISEMGRELSQRNRNRVRRREKKILAKTLRMWKSHTRQAEKWKRYGTNVWNRVSHKFGINRVYLRNSEKRIKFQSHVCNIFFFIQLQHNCGALVAVAVPVAMAPPGSANWKIWFYDYVQNLHFCHSKCTHHSDVSSGLSLCLSSRSYAIDLLAYTHLFRSVAPFNSYNVLVFQFNFWAGGVVLVDLIYCILIGNTYTHLAYLLVVSPVQFFLFFGIKTSTKIGN